MSRIVFLGLAITSSWGNGHATTYRALVSALGRRGHDVLFLERARPWYAEHRDLDQPPGGQVVVYGSLEELRDGFGREVAEADLVVVGSYVPDGIEVGDWVLERARGLAAFYDIDTPVTLDRLARDDCDYLRLEQIPRYEVYFSFGGGPILHHIESKLGSPRAVELACSVDLHQHRRQSCTLRYDLGYLGTYSADRQQKVQSLLLEPAAAWPEGRFAVAGPMFRDREQWPSNVAHVEHLPPEAHTAFYCQQRFTLNVTRAPMRRWGYSPSVRLFEAAACGVPVISDRWRGLQRYFDPGVEILVASDAAEVLRLLRGTSPERRSAMGRAARQRVERSHTAEHRAATLEAEIERHWRLTHPLLLPHRTDPTQA